jgi:hypothetical protein
MRREASDKIGTVYSVFVSCRPADPLGLDNVTAAYLQMQEVFSSYRQSPDPSSKRRVRECLNAGLRNLPEWP